MQISWVVLQMWTAPPPPPAPTFHLEELLGGHEHIAPDLLEPTDW